MRRRRAELAVDHRQIKLHAETRTEVVAGKNLRDGAVNVFAVARRFHAVVLQRAKVRELLGHASMKTCAAILRLLRRIDRAQVTGQNRSEERRVGKECRSRWS